MKKKYQVFTPETIANSMLDLANYNQFLYGIKVLENAAGDGNILSEVVERYILDCFNNGFDREKIRNGLEQDIFAYEIDEVHYNTCISRLNDIVKKHKIDKVNWSIYVNDFLKVQIDVKFDLIIGNPPYIKYNDLDIDTRKYIKENFKNCQDGKPDYYYAFIEKSINLMKQDGSFVYLIPNSLFKNVYADKTRQILLPKIERIRNYTSVKLFSELTTSAVIVCKNAALGQHVKYEDIKAKTSRSLLRSDLNGKWLFKEEEVRIRSSKFQDFFYASSTIATLCNGVFVIKKYIEHEEYVEFKGFKIEKGILKKAESIKMNQYNQKAYIIFPYYFSHRGDLIKISEIELESSFPGCYQYLLCHKGDLLDRKSDNSAKWFDYGRSQAIQKMNQDKLMISKVLSKKMQIYFLGSDTVPFSGNIVISKGIYDLGTAMKILESEIFLNYAQNVGTDAQSESIQLSPIDINNFEFNIDDFIG